MLPLTTICSRFRAKKTLNSHADNGLLLAQFLLHFDVVRKFYNRYREFESGECPKTLLSRPWRHFEWVKFPFGYQAINGKAMEVKILSDFLYGQNTFVFDAILYAIGEQGGTHLEATIANDAGGGVVKCSPNADIDRGHVALILNMPGRELSRSAACGNFLSHRYSRSFILLVSRLKLSSYS